MTALAQAEHHAATALLNCHVRETGAWRWEDDELVLPLPAGEVRVRARYRSATGRHQFALPARLNGSPVSYVTLAGLLLEPLGGSPTDLVVRMLDSLQAVARSFEVRADELDQLWGSGPLPYADSEQALLLGHLLHPAPKSRADMSPTEREATAPELGARTGLRWLAVRPHLVRHGSATGTPAPALTEALLREDPETDLAALDAALDGLGERVLLPLHPWEADHARRTHPGLYDTGDVVDLGVHGGPWRPTTSVRTLHRAGLPWQVKGSLHVRITNSQRVTLPKELGRAVEAARLEQSSIGARAREVAPDLRRLHDAAFLTVEVDGVVLDAFSVLLRENPWPGGTGEDVTALTTLEQDGPDGRPSRLAALVDAIAEREGRSTELVARDWFGRFLEVAVRSLVRLHLEVGLCFEAHSQNVLLELDAGWPVRCTYRDSQGYFTREAAHADVLAVLPGHGIATESVFGEALADERLVYYLFVNLTLGVVNALGTAGLVAEDLLLEDLRVLLEKERSRDTRYPATLLDRLLDDETWPCKANLLTRLHEMDELVGDISTQSVYVTVPNPLRSS